MPKKSMLSRVMSKLATKQAKDMTEEQRQERARKGGLAKARNAAAKKLVDSPASGE